MQLAWEMHIHAAVSGNVGESDAPKFTPMALFKEMPMAFPEDEPAITQPVAAPEDESQLSDEQKRRRSIKRIQRPPRR